MNIAIKALQAQREDRVGRLQEMRARATLLERELKDALDVVWDLEHEVGVLRAAIEMLVGAE